MKLLLILLALTLGACNGNNVKPDPLAPVKIEYVAPTIPSELFALPVRVDVPNPETATQYDVSKYMIDNEVRSNTLEGKLQSIKEIISDFKKNHNL